jgi:Flp pilus assembly protein TadG
MRHRTGLRDCRGQSLVEFAICALLTVAFVLMVLEFGRMMLVYTTIANAARIGTRYAIVHGSDNPPASGGVAAIVNDFLSAGTVTASNATVLPTYPGHPDGTNSGCTDPGCLVSVSVSYPYDPLMSYFPLGTITFRSSSQGVITW